MSFNESSRKLCRDCGTDKPAAEFWRSRASHDGLAPYCKPCFRVRNTASSERRAAKAGRTVRRQKSRTVVAAEGMRFCPRCEVVMPVSEFVRNRSTRDGIGTYCRPCQNAQSAASIAKLHGSTRHYHLKQRYGIGADDVLQMLRDQLWRCPICTVAMSLKTAHVDHDHRTGAVRAVVCFNCNGGLGQFKDDAKAMRRAAEYVEGDVSLVIKLAPGVYRLRS